MERISLKYVDPLATSPYYRGKSVGGSSIYRERRNNTFYTDLREKHKELANYSDKQIRDYIIGFNELIRDTLVEHRDGIVLPEHIGNLFIATYKPSKDRRPLDRVTTKKLGKRTYYHNRHSEGYTGWAHYTYNLEKYNFTNCKLWKFQPGYNLKSQMFEQFINGWKKYIVMPNIKYIHSFIRSYWKKEHIKRKLAAELASYDEFEGLT